MTAQKLVQLLRLSNLHFCDHVLIFAVCQIQKRIECIIIDLLVQALRNTLNKLNNYLREAQLEVLEVILI